MKSITTSRRTFIAITHAVTSIRSLDSTAGMQEGRQQIVARLWGTDLCATFTTRSTRTVSTGSTCVILGMRTQ